MTTIKPTRQFPIHLLLLCAIILLAVWLRVLRLDVTPPGLHYDEAFKALSARGILQTGQLQIFFTGNFGEEPLHATAGALWFLLVGERAWAIRFTSAVFGILLIPALYFCTRIFFRSTRAALVAAFVGATLYWSLNFSRIAIEPITLALLITLHFGTLGWLLNHFTSAKGKTLEMKSGLVAAGFFAGAIYYTYLASRITPLVYVLFGIYLLIFHRALLRANWKALALAFLVAGLTVAPLAWFFLNNPTAFFARAGQVLTPAQLGSNLSATAGMFFTRGDADPRDNLPGRPALDILLAFFFVVGILVSLRRWRKPQSTLLLLWLIVLTAPAVVTEFAPNFRRAIGALPVVIILCALGADEIARIVSSFARRARTRLASVGTNSILALLLCVSAFLSAHDYFVTWANDPGLFYSFDAGLLRVAQYLAARPPNEQLCLSPNYVDHPTVLWALNGRAYSTFDGRRVAVLPDSAHATTCAIITYEDQIYSPAQYFPNAQRLATFDDFAGQPYAQVFLIPAGANSSIQPQDSLDARVGAGVRVRGYTLTREGQQFDLQIFWQPEQALNADYTVFVHLLGPFNLSTQSSVWAQEDSQVGDGTYPTSRWRVGETIIDHYTLRLPDDAPHATYQIEVGMYLLATGERLPVFVNGVRIPEDRLLIPDP